MKNRLWNPARLIDIGGLELKSCESTTQCDLLGIAIYAIRITTVMNIMLLAVQNDHSRIVEYQDDITAAGELRAIGKRSDSLL